MLMDKLVIPPYLTDGDRIEIISPASHIDEDLVCQAAAMLEQSGFRVTYGKHLFSRSGPFAGTDEERLDDIQRATDDPDVKAVLCSRGGYGMTRIVDRIDFTALQKTPKWYVGYSDITSLHMWLSNVCGIASLHAEMPLNYTDPACLPASYGTMVQALRGEAAPVSWNPGSEGAYALTGRFTGGNISLLYSLHGTVAQPDTDGAILFIEDIGEKYYHLDRMLVSMRLAGLLSNLSALVVGGMEKITEGEHVFNQTVEEVVMNVAGGFGYPVLFNFPAGHIPDNRALYIGRQARIVHDGATAELSWQQGVPASG